MTNLRPGVSAPVLTRERLLVGGPILLSAVICLAAGLGLGLPALNRVNDLKSEAADLEAKTANLPLLEVQLQQEKEKQQVLLDQQMMLVDLLAGSDRIATFLALLEQEATATGVTIVRYEPLQPPPPQPPQQPAQSRSAAADNAPPADPLITLGYRQTSVVLGVQGPFNSVQTFLRRMEGLEVLVEASELELDQLTQSSEGAASGTELALKLAFFDRATPVEPEPDPNSAPASDQE